MVTVMQIDKEKTKLVVALCKKLQIRHKMFSIPDGPFQDPDRKLATDILPWLQEAEEKQIRTLVHCHGGISRSPSLVITFMVWRGVDFIDALVDTVNSHPTARPHPDVLKSFLYCVEHELPPKYRKWWKKQKELGSLL